MKRYELRKIKDKSPEELQKDLSTVQEELRTLKFDLIAGKTKKIRTILDAKKKIARIMTCLNEKK